MGFENHPAAAGRGRDPSRCWTDNSSSLYLAISPRVKKLKLIDGNPHGNPSLFEHDLGSSVLDAKEFLLNLNSLNRFRNDV